LANIAALQYYAAFLLKNNRLPLPISRLNFAGSKIETLKVFKFGGASVKDAEAVINVAGILESYKDEPLLVVVSAMGKTTNALERLARAYFDKKNEAASACYQEVKTFHDNIISDLLQNTDSKAYDDIENLFIELECLLETHPEGSFDFNYDQIVGYGEIFSSKIISTYLNQIGLQNRWIDARNFINTDSNYREARVDWEITEKLIDRKIKPLIQKQLLITQGFIGQSKEKQNTTLGREGSDYTAAIFAYALSADSVTIWKDVPGVMNADPKRMPDAQIIHHLNYDEAIELAYYGATVIHPKTIQPLKNRNIPLYVKSFVNPKAEGTLINGQISTDTVMQTFIFKDNQVLISLSTKDFSFIAEEHLKHIFALLSAHKLRVNLMQNTAISTSFVLNNDPEKVLVWLQKLETDYDCSSKADVKLITIRNYNQEAIQKISSGSEIMLEQRNGRRIQLVI